MKLIMLVCVIVVIVVGLVEGWSTLHGANKAYVDYYKSQQHAGQRLDNCKDYPDIDCKKLEKHCENLIVQKQCKRTCGLCPAGSPVSCESSPFGCCWDNITASGPFGRGCPDCEDKHVSCIENLPQCNIGHVRRACPITCEVRACVEGTYNCFDDPRQAAFCKIFKQSGFCIIDPGLMQAYCRRTCNFCNLNFQITNQEYDRYKVKEKSAGVGHDQPSEKKQSTLEEKDEQVEETEKKESKIKDSKIEEVSTKKEVKKSGIEKAPVRKLEKKSVKSETKEKVEEKKSANKNENIKLVNDQLEKKTTELINDLIRDTVSQQKTPKKRTKEKDELERKKISKDESKRNTKVEELETVLLDMLLKEKSKED